MYDYMVRSLKHQVALGLVILIIPFRRHFGHLVLVISQSDRVELAHILRVARQDFIFDALGQRWQPIDRVVQTVAMLVIVMIRATAHMAIMSHIAHIRLA